MKVIGATPSGGRIVELTEAESREFERLTLALEGRRIDELHVTLSDGHLSPEMAPTFAAIRGFALLRFRVNEIRSLADALDALAGTPAGK